MTIILAVQEPDGVFIGADSRSSTDYVYSDDATKLSRVHNFIVGISGSTRVQQLVGYQADRFDSIESDADVFAFARVLQQVLAEEYAIKTNGSEGEKWTLLAATPVGVYTVHRNFQFHRRMSSWAIGSGDDYGLGAYRAMGDMPDTEARIRRAIEMTAEYIPSVGGATTVHKVA